MRLGVALLPFGKTDEERRTSEALTRSLRDITSQVNGVSEGRMYSHHGARATAPTTESWAVGDSVKNSAPSELGSSPNKYVVTGFLCVAAGTPGTWVSMRSLTGN